MSGCCDGGMLEFNFGELPWRHAAEPPCGACRAVKDAASGNAPALVAADGGYTNTALSVMLHIAAANAHSPSSEAWADVERATRRTLLHLACQWGDLALAREALSRAPETVGCLDAEGLLPVEVAAYYTRTSLLHWLLEEDVSGSDGAAAAGPAFSSLMESTTAANDVDVGEGDGEAATAAGQATGRLLRL